METVLRALAVYLFLLIVVRFTGRRTLSQLTAFDFVLLLIVAQTTQLALLGDDYSVTNCFVLILALFSFDILLSYLKEWSPRAAKWVDGSPTVLVSQGRIDEAAMRGARVDLNDVLESARVKHGIERLDQIRFAVLEISGDISIVPAR